MAGVVVELPYVTMSFPSILITVDITSLPAVAVVNVGVSLYVSTKELTLFLPLKDNVGDVPGLPALLNTASPAILPTISVFI